MSVDSNPLKYPDCIEDALETTKDGGTCEATLLISGGNVYVTNLMFSTMWVPRYEEDVFFVEMEDPDELPAEPDFTIDNPFDIDDEDEEFVPYEDDLSYTW